MIPFNTPHTWLEIDRSALDHNIEQYRKIAGQRKIALVVKGDAYGHGMKQIVSLTNHNDNIDWYCTFSLSEAMQLRAIKVHKAILVLTLIDEDASLAIKHDIDVVILDTNQLQIITEKAQQFGKPARIHIKIDTGLSRFGFLPDDALSLIKKIKQNKYLMLQGVCTHFAAAEQDDQSYTKWQLDQFNNLLAALKKCNIQIPYIHAQATSATIRQSQTDCTMVRIGAGIYGLYPSYSIKNELYLKHGSTLQQILTWKSYVCSMRTLTKGSFVGYGCTYTTEGETRIAMIPVGYADGYHRRLSNIGKVLINNQYAPVIGRVAMNVITVNITHIADVTIGSEVILMGNYQGLTALDIAEQIGAHNPREITLRLSSSLERKIVSCHQHILLNNSIEQQSNMLNISE